MIRESVLINACVQQGLFSDELVKETQKQTRRSQQNLLQGLAYQARMPMSAFYRAYAGLHRIPFITGGALIPDLKVFRKLPMGMAERKLLLPIVQNSDTHGAANDRLTERRTRIRMVVSNPEDQAGIQQLERSLGASIDLCMADPKAIRYALQKAIEATPSIVPSELPELAFDSVQVLDEVFEEAWLCRASDIHIEPYKESIQVRLRVDGRLQEYPRQFLVEEGLSLMSRMKVLASMDISEQRMPQDGGLTHTLANGIEFDVRAATMPTRFGERATLRLLGSDNQALSLSNIGMGARDQALFEREIRKPHGIILITGPTGSGKSTTLYAALQHIADTELNIMTVEDPVEYVMEGISQVQVGAKVSFSSALRSFLRHDPDVMMVGEIRDGETAGIAMKAAMTGHLVFSTLHTNSAIGAVNRLVDMDAERYLIGATLLAVIAQRLVRKLCPQCKQQRPVSEAEQATLKCEPDAQVWVPAGCAHCLDSGYKGRIALFETYWIDAKARQMIAEDATEAELREHASEFSDLLSDGRQKVLQGVTSISELQRLGLIQVFDEGVL
jgi:type IV pilus assembly protein PilB